MEVLQKLFGIEKCPECHCSTGDDTKYKDFSNKTIAICTQCGHEFDLAEYNQLDEGGDRK